MINGATADSLRIASMIDKNLDLIDEVYVTLDSHHINHIAHQSFWEWGNPKRDPSTDPRCDLKRLQNEAAKEKSGYPKDERIRPAVYSPIMSSDVIEGVWIPVDRSLRDYCISYTQQLEKKGKFTLSIWPNHCLIGTVGHSVVPNINAALQKWTRHTMKIVNFVHKGMNCLTEMYSAIEAEVPVATDSTTTKNHDLLRRLRHPKRLIVCGQALTHCVCWTVYDILTDWRAHGCDVSVMYLLRDGTSPVSVGDFPAKGEAFKKQISELGVKISSTLEAFEGL